MKRFFKAFRFAAILFGGLIALALVYVGVSNWRSNARLAKKLAELRAAGQPVRLAELAREPIPPESNAATYLRRAKEDSKAIEKEVDAAYETASESDQDAFDEAQPTAAMIDAIRSALEAFPAVVPLIDRAADCPDYDSQLDYSTDARAFLDAQISTNSSRTYIRVLRYRAFLLLADGKPDEAMETCITMFRLARHFDRDPTIVNHLISLACRWSASQTAAAVLRSGLVSNALHDALERELADQDLVAAAQHALITERPLGLELSQYEFADMRIGWLPWFRKLRCDYLDLVGEAIAIVSLPRTDTAGRAKYKAILEGAWLAGLIDPGIQAMQDSTLQGRADMCCLRVLNALTRNSEANASAEPKLTDLGLPADATIDPFNGAPLHLKKLPEGWLIYSVGANLKDDGGDVEDKKDVGLGPRRVVVEHAADGDPESHE
jgi:hypothetical protein